MQASLSIFAPLLQKLSFLFYLAKFTKIVLEQRYLEMIAP